MKIRDLNDTWSETDEGVARTTSNSVTDKLIKLLWPMARVSLVQLVRETLYGFYRSAVLAERARHLTHAPKPKPAGKKTR
jgi:hypothetical protein